MLDRNRVSIRFGHILSEHSSFISDFKFIDIWPVVISRLEDSFLKLSTNVEAAWKYFDEFISIIQKKYIGELCHVARHLYLLCDSPKGIFTWENRDSQFHGSNGVSFLYFSNNREFHHEQFKTVLQYYEFKI